MCNLTAHFCSTSKPSPRVVSTFGLCNQICADQGYCYCSKFTSAGAQMPMFSQRSVEVSSLVHMAIIKKLLKIQHLQKALASASARKRMMKSYDSLSISYTFLDYTKMFKITGLLLSQQIAMERLLAPRSCGTCHICQAISKTKGAGFIHLHCSWQRICLQSELQLVPWVWREGKKENGNSSRGRRD